MTEVHDRVFQIHAMTQKAESYIEWQLERLGSPKDTGWSPAAMPMRDLYNDAKTLRMLAAKLDNIREKMTSEAA